MQVVNGGTEKGQKVPQSDDEKRQLEEAYEKAKAQQRAKEAQEKAQRLNDADEKALDRIETPLEHLTFAPVWFANFSLPHSRSEEHTSELQSRFDLVYRLLLKKKNIT